MQCKVLLLHYVPTWRLNLTKGYVSNLLHTVILYESEALWFNKRKVLSTSKMLVYMLKQTKLFSPFIGSNKSISLLKVLYYRKYCD